MIEDQNPYVLVSKRQKGLNASRLRFVFHRAVNDIGIDRPRQVIGHTVFGSPTPHSLRHSFAVNTLKRIQERGDSTRTACFSRLYRPCVLSANRHLPEVH